MFFDKREGELVSDVEPMLNEGTVEAADPAMAV